MANQLIWQERYNIGVDAIDREHRKLFSIINRLLTISDQKSKSQWACEESIKYFKNYALKHFAEEEGYMASIRYANFETHRRLHDDFRKKTLPELEKELMQTNYSPDAVSHFLSVCAGWLVSHTLTEDHAITGQATSKWGDLLPEERQAAIQQVIREFLEELFQLDARIVSDHYGGEKFGKGIYYRLIYEKKDKTSWESILIFEEKLILGTVGKILNIKTDTINVMLMNATRYMVRQFVQRIEEHFPSSEDYELKHENLLSYEQFLKIFNNERPQCSLLFNTGEGYFAYCTGAPHVIHKNETVTSIKAENAIPEIEKYLKNNTEDQKQKILLVDDSDLVLYAMQKLLGNDYQITTAKSGLAAIRCITLDRPDLILLDYEMPACDGSQVLGMIRAEEDFADIPVIFLTGRADKESVSKVMALKPVGYLLKTLQSEEIKKNIDGFFRKKAKKL